MTSVETEDIISTVKTNLTMMKNCLRESLDLCTDLENDMVENLRNELARADQRIKELENENSTLKLLVIDMKNMKMDTSSCLGAGGMTESLQNEVDQNLLKAKQEIYKLKEVIETLKNEIQVLTVEKMTYKEDFEMERSDRERAQGKVNDLQRQLALYTDNKNQRFSAYSEPHHLQHNCQVARGRGFDVCDAGNHTTNNVDHEADFPGCYENDLAVDVCDLSEYDEKQMHTELVGRGIDSGSNCLTDNRSTALSNRQTSNYQLQEIESGYSPNAFENSCSPTVSQKNSANVLHCPSCWKSFLPEDHVHLLDHLEVCK